MRSNASAFFVRGPTSACSRLMSDGRQGHTRSVLNDVERTMNKNWLGVIGAVLVIALIVWLLGGFRLSCHKSFWDENKQIIEIEHD
jgi:hypothetical protein